MAASKDDVSASSQRSRPRTGQGTSHVNILLADGRAMLREGQRLLLEQRPELRVVGEAESTQSVPKMVRALDVQVVVLNATLSTRSLVEPVRLIHKTHPQVSVLVLGLHPTVALVRELVDAGASGCLTKDCTSEELIAAIGAVRGGRTYFSPRIAEFVMQTYGGGARGGRDAEGHAQLTPRERQILQFIADGATTRQIAVSLHIGTKTVETFRRRIMEKLGRRSVAELTKYAVLEGLTFLEPQN